MTTFEIVSVVFTIISAAFTFATLRLVQKELRENRDYNETSIKPLLTITKHFGGSQKRYGIAVKNAGLGPAIINRCEILVGSDIMEEDGNHGWNAAIEKLELKNEMVLKISNVAPNGKIAHGDRVWLLYIADESSNEDNRHELEKAVENSQLDIVIRYKSMFGKEFTERFRQKL